MSDNTVTLRRPAPTRIPDHGPSRIPERKVWRAELAPYLALDRGRSLAQIASVVLPYLGVWVLAVIAEPPWWAAIGLGLVATVFLVRMYSSSTRTALGKEANAVRKGDEPTRAELEKRARKLDIKGRSKMGKAELKRAVARAEG